MLPHELVKLRGQYLQIIVRTHCKRLLTRCYTSNIDLINQEFEELIVAHQSDETFNKSLDECYYYMVFQDDWSYTGGRFLML